MRKGEKEPHGRIQEGPCGTVRIKGQGGVWQDVPRDGFDWEIRSDDVEGMSREEVEYWMRLANMDGNPEGRRVRRIRGVAGQAGTGRVVSSSGELPSGSWPRFCGGKGCDWDDTES